MCVIAVHPTAHRECLRLHESQWLQNSLGYPQSSSVIQWRAMKNNNYMINLIRTVSTVHSSYRKSQSSGLLPSLGAVTDIQLIEWLMGVNQDLMKCG